MSINPNQVVFEDNHILVINKMGGQLTQKDPKGEPGIEDWAKEYIRVKYNKPGEAFIGVVHRLDRPVSGIVLLAKTSKALVRLNKIFQERAIVKTYWAIVKNKPENEEGRLEHWMLRNEKTNMSKCFDKEVKNSKKAILDYKLIGSSDTYHLLEVTLHTGRHHQIRAQLSTMGCPIKGDLKYGFARSNSEGFIHLHSRSIEFTHPVKEENIKVVAPAPDNDSVWKYFNALFPVA